MARVAEAMVAVARVAVLKTFKLVVVAFVKVAFAANRLVEFRLVAVDDAAVVVEKVEVAVNVAGEAVVSAPDTLRFVTVALVIVAKVPLAFTKLEVVALVVVE